MKISKLENGKWEWRIRFVGMIGQANGFSSSREEAIDEVFKRLKYFYG